jgi:hypothetical protein
MATLGNTLQSTSTSTLAVTTKKPIVCPWYCYPIGVCAILAVLILLTLCISACDYRYSKKRQQSKVTDGGDEKASVDTAREKLEDDDDDESAASMDTEER